MPARYELFNVVALDRHVLVPSITVPVQVKSSHLIWYRYLGLGQLLLSRVFFVRNTSARRTYFSTFRLRVEAHALYTECRIYYIYPIAITYGFGWTFHLAGTTVYAIRGDLVGHLTSP